MTYETLLKIAEDERIEVHELDFPDGIKGLYGDNIIGINKGIETHKEKKCVLLEELGHYHTSTGNIINLSDIGNAKQEYKARLWAYNNQIGLTGIIQAYENKCTNLYEMAEYLNVTEEFLIDALTCYKNKYGISVKIDNYIIYFEPNLYVMKLL